MPDVIPTASIFKQIPCNDWAFFQLAVHIDDEAPGYYYWSRENDGERSWTVSLASIHGPRYAPKVLCCLSPNRSWWSSDKSPQRGFAQPQFRNGGSANVGSS